METKTQESQQSWEALPRSRRALVVHVERHLEGERAKWGTCRAFPVVGDSLHQPCFDCEGLEIAEK